MVCKIIRDDAIRLTDTPVDYCGAVRASVVLSVPAAVDLGNAVGAVILV